MNILYKLMIVIHPLIKALVLIMFLINVVSIVMFLECTLVGTVTVTDFTCDPPPPLSGSCGYTYYTKL